MRKFCNNLVPRLFSLVLWCHSLPKRPWVREWFYNYDLNTTLQFYKFDLLNLKGGPG